MVSPHQKTEKSSTWHRLERSSRGFASSFQEPRSGDLWLWFCDGGGSSGGCDGGCGCCLLLVVLVAPSVVVVVAFLDTKDFVTTLEKS